MPQVDVRYVRGGAGTVQRWATDYNSRFTAWEQQAVVRRSHTIAPFEGPLYFFSRTVSPLFSHDTVSKAPQDVQRGLLVLSLFDWLEFTVWLEIGPVNQACEILRRAHFLPWLPQQMRSDALKIYTDEAGHAQMSYELARAAEAATGYTSLQLRPPFLDEFDEMLAQHDPQLEPILTLLFAIVSETLITGSLKRLPRDATVQQAVRDFASHHAQDEARHHHYFRGLCEMLWPRLPYELRRILGPLLPGMVLTFLRPSYSGLTRLLAEFDDHFPNPPQLAEEIFSSEAIHAGLLEACQPTLRMFANCGVFDDREVLDSFNDAGLAPPQSILERRARR